MEYNTTPLCCVELILLLSSVTLQIVSLSAPGWDNSNYEGIDINNGIFYYRSCLGRKCNTYSKHDLYHSFLESVASSERNYPIESSFIIRTRREYHKDVAEQVFMILAFTSTLLCLAFQVHKRRHVQASFRRAAGAASLCLSFASGLMIVSLTPYFIIFERGLRLSKDDDYYITFPYCVLLYILAFQANIITVVFFMREIFRRDDSAPQHETQRNLHESGITSTTTREPTFVEARL